MGAMPAAGPDLSGRTMFVTGAAGGIGFETARELARRGARVLLGVRDAARGAPAAEKIARESGRAEVVPVDMASFASIRAAAAGLAAGEKRLDVLVNNAGVATRDRRLGPDGHELIWTTNFLGPFLLTGLLLPLLEAAPRARVVNVASAAHYRGRLDWSDLECERGFGGFQSYCNSKLALVLFTRELARRHPRIDINAVHPGTIATGIWRAAPPPARALLALVLPSARRGARPVIRLAASPDVEGVTGRYFDKFREANPASAARIDANALRLWQIAEGATAAAGAA